MGRRMYHHRYRRGAGSPGFFSVLAALAVLWLTGAAAVVVPLFLVLVGAVALTVAVSALKLMVEWCSGWCAS